MRIVVIGTGNAATALARLMQVRGHVIEQVFGRDILKSEALAAVVNARPVSLLSDLSRNADVYLIAVSDKAVKNIVEDLQVNDQLVLHTTASLSQHVLQEASTRYGVLYPLQSLRREMDIDTPVPFLVDGNNEAVTLQVESFARTLSHTVVRAGDQVRMKLHVAAVFACNFSNYMYLMSEAFCRKEGLDFSLLQPLIEETATRLQEFSPSEVFTGPAVRGDMETINKHLSLLEAYPELHEMYQSLTDKIMEQVRRNA